MTPRTTVHYVSKIIVRIQIYFIPKQMTYFMSKRSPVCTLAHINTIKVRVGKSRRIARQFGIFVFRKLPLWEVEVAASKTAPGTVGTLMHRHRTPYGFYN